MDDAQFFARLHADLQAMQSIALAEDLARDKSVPSCPGWTVADLFGHVVSNHRWVRTILRTRERADAPPPTPDPVADFVDSVADQLIAVRNIAPDEPCWNFGPPPRVAGFWTRRQAHEHVIHHWDLANALGLPDIEIDAELAADGVDEVIGMFYPFQLRLGRTGLVDKAIRFESTDTGDAWTLGDGEPVAAVRATARELYLGLWKRVPLIGDVEGDGPAVESALSRALTP